MCAILRGSKTCVGTRVKTVTHSLGGEEAVTRHRGFGVSQRKYPLSKGVGTQPVSILVLLECVEYFFTDSF